MRSLCTALFFPGLLSMSCQPIGPPNEPASEQQPESGEEVTFFTRDSVLIYGDQYVQDSQGTTLILFHQGGSNARAEYRDIIPDLLADGYNVLAIDQRQGGQIYGLHNRTIARLTFDDWGYHYCEAMPDLEGALDYAERTGLRGPFIIWGSSYSAALAIQLATRRPKDVRAVLAFSPATGPPMQDCLPHPYLEKTEVPVLVLRPPSEVDGDEVQQIIDGGENPNISFYLADPGVHGSSMLVADRVGDEVESHWEAVRSFLEKVSR